MAHGPESSFAVQHHGPPNHSKNLWIKAVKAPPGLQSLRESNLPDPQAGKPLPTSYIPGKPPPSHDFLLGCHWHPPCSPASGWKAFQTSCLSVLNGGQRVNWEPSLCKGAWKGGWPFISSLKKRSPYPPTRAKNELQNWKGNKNKKWLISVTNSKSSHDSALTP